MGGRSIILRSWNYFAKHHHKVWEGNGCSLAIKWFSSLHGWKTKFGHLSWVKGQTLSMTAIGKAQKSPKSAVIMYCRNTVRRGGVKKPHYLILQILNLWPLRRYTGIAELGWSLVVSESAAHTFVQLECSFMLPCTTLHSMMNAKLSKQRFWHFYENGLIKTIQIIPHNL